jgi:hypothetical protein
MIVFRKRSFHVFGLVSIKKSSRVILMTIFGIMIIGSYTILNSTMLSYAEPSILVGCGPTQQPNLSISISINGFLPNVFLHYKYVRSDNSMVFGGFSTGASGKNSIAVNTGPNQGTYAIYIYKDTDSYNNNTARPIYSSTITVPCIANHFTIEYYKNHPELIQSLLGVQSIYNKVKLGNYLVASPTNALKVFYSSASSAILDQLAAQLLAAELNTANGASSDCIDEAISHANEFLKSQNYYGPTNLSRPSINDLHVLYKSLSFNHDMREYNRIGCIFDK